MHENIVEIEDKEYDSNLNIDKKNIKNKKY
jgi:hypothetical protein